MEMRLNTDDECEYWKVVLSQITFSGLSFVLGVQMDEDEFDEDDEDDEDDENDEEDEEDDEDELELEPAKVLYHLDPMNVGLCLHGYSALYI